LKFSDIDVNLFIIFVPREGYMNIDKVVNADYIHKGVFDNSNEYSKRVNPGNEKAVQKAPVKEETKGNKIDMSA